MEQEKSLDPQLWHAFAGSTVQIPSLNSTVFYFPQGHLEHAQAPTDFHAPCVPPLILCRVVALKFLAGADTDDVYAKITLLPLPDDAVVSPLPPGGNGSEKPVFFTKTLTHNDTNDGGGFSVPRRCAETVFPRLDYTAKSPVQTIIAKDIHGETWKFRHTFSGTPRRHVLTTGWSTFVERKNLIAGDSVVFFRSETGDLCVGVRRVKRWPYPWISNFIRGDVNTVERVTVEAVAEAVACGQPFEVVYYPGANTPEFCVKAADVRAAMRIRWCSGMRFKMAFELDDFSGISWFTGTVSAVEVADPIRWPDSPWRLLQVAWDEPGLLRKVKRVNPWLVELVSEMPAASVHISPKKKLRTQPPFDGITSVAGDWDDEITVNLQGKIYKYEPIWEWEQVESEKSSSKQPMDKDEELARTVAESLRDAKFSRSTDVSGISSVAGDGDDEITVTDNLQGVLWKVNKYESEKSRSKQHMDENMPPDYLLE